MRSLKMVLRYSPSMAELGWQTLFPPSLKKPRSASASNCRCTNSSPSRSKSWNNEFTRKSSSRQPCNCLSLCLVSRDLLAIVIEREIGTIDRFPSAQQFSSYAGTTPRVSSSGGKTRYGKMRTESNQYLKWAFIEAANAISGHHAQKDWADRHCSRLYLRVRSRKGSSVAIGAVARHLDESAFWVLKKNEPYKEPVAKVSTRQG
jgi:hypothetical protein